MASSINPMVHGVRGYFRFAHIDGVTPSDPAVYARLPGVHRDESCTQGLDRLELIRFLPVAQTITVHRGALAYLLGINALRDPKPPQSGSRTTPRPCAATGCSTSSGKATNQPPCPSLSQSYESSKPAEANGPADH
jgi:hypothetical protein